MRAGRRAGRDAATAPQLSTALTRWLAGVLVAFVDSFRLDAQTGFNETGCMQHGGTVQGSCNTKNFAGLGHRSTRVYSKPPATSSIPIDPPAAGRMYCTVQIDFKLRETAGRMQWQHDHGN